MIQIYPATPYDVGKVNNFLHGSLRSASHVSRFQIIRSIEETFPRASAIPSLSSSELVLRWKVSIALLLTRTTAAPTVSLSGGDS